MRHQWLQVETGRRSLTAAVRISDRARQVRLRIVPGLGLEVVLPRGVDQTWLPEIINKQLQWIEAHGPAIEKAAEAGGRGKEVLPSGVRLPAIGQGWEVGYSMSPLGRPRVREHGSGQLSVPADPELETQRCLRLLQAWLRDKARSFLVDWVHDLAGQHGFSVARVQIRRQRTRWGSMSSSGTMSLNCLLLFFEPCLVQSVILHELCHIRFPNHGPGFTSLLTSLCPEWPELRAELRHDARRSVPMWAQVELG